jgi:hypothetical protein
MLAPRLSAAAAELPELRARLAELQAAAKTRDIVIDGASDAIAAANLQSRLEELAKSVGVTIGSTEGIAAENRGGYRRIGLRLVISGDLSPGRRERFPLVRRAREAVTYAIDRHERRAAVFATLVTGGRRQEGRRCRSGSTKSPTSLTGRWFPLARRGSAKAMSLLR